MNRCCVLASFALALHGCGASGPTRPDARAAEVRAGSDGVDGGGTASSEPVPELATQAYDRALAAMLSGDTIEAELELEQLILAHPAYPGPYVNLAILYRQSGRNAEAREALEQALALDPEHATANNQLGILLRSEGQFAEAEAAYSRAIAADPDYALAYYNLGVLLDLYLQRPAEALAYYQRYQETQAEPDERVGLWIIDLRRRLGVTAEEARVAQEDAP